MSLKFVKFPDILLKVRDAFFGELATSLEIWLHFGYKLQIKRPSRYLKGRFLEVPSGGLKADLIETNFRHF